MESRETKLEACQSLLSVNNFFFGGEGHGAVLRSTNFCETPVTLHVAHEAK
jgi:hypothetical protein